MTAKPRHLIALSFISNLKGNRDLTRSLLEISADGLLRCRQKFSGDGLLQAADAASAQAAWSLGIKQTLSLQKPISFGEQLKQHPCMVLIGKMSANSEALVQSKFMQSPHN